MNIPSPKRSVAAAVLAWLREHILLTVFGVCTAFVFAIAAADSLYVGSAGPFVVFLIFGAVIVPGVVRLDRRMRKDKGKT